MHTRHVMRSAADRPPSAGLVSRDMGNRVNIHSVGSEMSMTVDRPAPTGTSLKSGPVSDAARRNQVRLADVNFSGRRDVDGVLAEQDAIREVV